MRESPLTPGERRRLLALARDAVVAAVADGSRPVPEPADLPAASGVFVTIKRNGQLRGCIGTLQMRLGLADEVLRAAVQSATEDPRFPPLGAEELPELRLEISVLGPQEPVPAREDAFTIGVHGLIVEDGFRRGLLLPQVPVEWGWTPEQFLRQTCVKAGLSPNAWREGARVYRFAADVFGE